jgi:hypothetical protein
MILTILSPKKWRKSHVLRQIRARYLCIEAEKIITTLLFKKNAIFSEKLAKILPDTFLVAKSFRLQNN